MADEVEKFANSAIQNFGMSELTAKRMASTFMSMANGMGLAAKDGKNMSLQLTALAGDMASFYNVEQDVAQTALSSIFTGETESLKNSVLFLQKQTLMLLPYQEVSQNLIMLCRRQRRQHYVINMF